MFVGKCEETIMWQFFLLFLLVGMPWSMAVLGLFLSPGERRGYFDVYEKLCATAPKVKTFGVMVE